MGIPFEIFLQKFEETICWHYYTVMVMLESQTDKRINGEKTLIESNKQMSAQNKKTKGEKSR